VTGDRPGSSPRSGSLHAADRGLTTGRLAAFRPLRTLRCATLPTSSASIEPLVAGGRDPDQTAR
jgi:hypothetical protein